jgi:hypothetical protein
MVRRSLDRRHYTNGPPSRIPPSGWRPATALTMLPAATADAVSVITELATDRGKRPAVRRLAATVLAEVSPAQLAAAANTLRELHHDAGVALALRLMAAADLGGLGPRTGATARHSCAPRRTPASRAPGCWPAACSPPSRSAERQSGLDTIDRLESTTDLAPRIAARRPPTRCRLNGSRHSHPPTPSSDESGLRLRALGGTTCRPQCRELPERRPRPATPRPIGAVLTAGEGPAAG